ncbi:MAG: hypothetical protein EBR82_50815 [Caulobacteraceae bacterium]|nr:hypothetical protein [Caulobacteraceae bacterium]
MSSARPTPNRVQVGTDQRVKFQPRKARAKDAPVRYDPITRVLTDLDLAMSAPEELRPDKLREWRESLYDRLGLRWRPQAGT